MLPHRTLIVCSLVVSASACARPQPRTSPPPSPTAESHRPGAFGEHHASPDRDRGIERLRRLVSDSKFQDPRALVLLAAMELQRARELADGASERELARENLQRALAIDDGYLPALNQLAVYYLDLARAHAGDDEQRSKAVTRLSRPRPEQRKLSRRHLELASFVVERALARDADYAP